MQYLKIKQNLKLFIFKFLLLFIAFIIISFTQSIFAMENPSKSVKSTGGTYVCDKGRDLDKVIERRHPKNGIIVFDIDMTGELPKFLAKLSLNAYDVDEERGEKNQVFFNENMIGHLSGTNNSWNTTVLNVKPEFVKKGKNEIRIEITDASKTGTINWSTKVNWGQLLVDEGAANQGKILGYLIKIGLLPDTPITAETLLPIEIITDIDPLTDGEFRLETTLLDSKENALLSEIHDLKLVKNNPQKCNINMSFKNSTPNGKYHVVTSLFYKHKGLWVQQSVSKKEFEHTRIIKPRKLEFVLTKPFQPIMVNEDAPQTLIKLDDHFSCSIKPCEPITFSLSKPSTGPVVSAKIIEHRLIIDYLPNQYGKAEIGISGQLKSKQLDQILQIVVSSVDDPPYVSAPLKQVTLKEDSSKSIDISLLFNDIDNDNAAILTKIAANSNKTLISATLLNNELVLSPITNKSGQGEIILLASSNGKVVQTPLLIVVEPVDDPPEVSEPLKKVTFKEDAPEKTIDISNFFNDVDNNNRVIQTKIIKNSNEALISALISDNQLKLSPYADKSGQSEVILQATSNGKSVQTPLLIEVEPVDDPPFIMEEIQDIKVQSGHIGTLLDLQAVFSDSDTPADAIILSVKSNSNPDLVHANISEKDLHLDFSQSNIGDAVIDIVAISNHQEISTSFNVSVIPTPATLYLLSSIGSQQVSNYSNTSYLQFGAGMKLDQYLNGLTIEMQYSNVLGQNRRDGNSQTVGYKTDLETSCLGVHAGYTLYSIGLAGDNLLSIHSLNFTAKAGLVYRQEKLVSTPEDTTKAQKNPDNSYSSSDLSVGLTMYCPISGLSEISVDTWVLGQNIWNIGVGYRYFFTN